MAEDTEEMVERLAKLAPVFYRNHIRELGFSQLKSYDFF